MGRINTVNPSVQSVKTLEDLRRFVGSALIALLDQVNGKLNFKDNVRASGPFELSLVANEPTRVFHDLAAVPQGTVILWKDAASDIIRPQGSQYEWTAQQIFIQSTADVNIGFYIV